MLSINDRLCPNEEHVAAKVVDDEAILINLANGFYYSMDKVGSLIWTLIEQHYSIEEIAKSVSGQFEVSYKTAQGDVQRLITELVQENLVSISSLPAQSNTDIRKNYAVDNKPPYTSPQITKFDDMAEMFALDPPLPGLAKSSSQQIA